MISSLSLRFLCYSSNRGHLTPCVTPSTKYLTFSCLFWLSHPLTPSAVILISIFPSKLFLLPLSLFAQFVCFFLFFSWSWSFPGDKSPSSMEHGSMLVGTFRSWLLLAMLLDSGSSPSLPATLRAWFLHRRLFSVSLLSLASFRMFNFVGSLTPHNLKSWTGSPSSSGFWVASQIALTGFILRAWTRKQQPSRKSLGHHLLSFCTGTQLVWALGKTWLDWLTLEWEIEESQASAGTKPGEHPGNQPALSSRSGSNSYQLWDLRRVI